MYKHWMSTTSKYSVIFDRCSLWCVFTKTKCTHKTTGKHHTMKLKSYRIWVHFTWVIALGWTHRYTNAEFINKRIFRKSGMNNTSKYMLLYFLYIMSTSYVYIWQLVMFVMNCPPCLILETYRVLHNYIPQATNNLWLK